MKVFVTISFLILGAGVQAQSLVVPSGVDLSAGPQSSITAGGNFLNQGVSAFMTGSELFVLDSLQNDSTLTFGSEAMVSVTGPVNNNSQITIAQQGSFVSNADLQNSGSISLDQEGMLNIGGDVQSSGEIEIGNNSTVAILGDLNNAGSFILLEGVQSSVGGDVLNSGILDNSGTFDMGGDWENTGTIGFYNNLSFSGSGDQVFEDRTAGVILNELMLESEGIVTLNINDVTLEGDLGFNSGILRVSEGGSFLVNLASNTGGLITGGNNNSYFDGALRVRQEGNSTLTLPLGDGDRYMPLELFDLETNGDPYVISAEYTSPSPVIPQPDEDVVGVSDSSLWTIIIEEGQMDSATVFIDFANEDLSTFEVFNDINAENIVPIIAYTDSLEGQFESLGGVLEATDSLTYGLITSESKVPLSGDIAFLGIGRAPVIAPDLKIYVPDVFSPLDSRVSNQSFRVFGEFVSENNFNMKIYNQLNILMYETSSFQEANEVGWDGTYRGQEQPRGTYFVIVDYDLSNTPDENSNGPDQTIRKAFYLVK